MATYRFRVIFEDHDEVIRDIEIRATQTFDDLHHAIHNSIGFDGSKPSSFYMSDDNWKKGKEITSKELSEEESETKVIMKKARLCDYIADPHQKIYYVFDFASPWTFRIELIKINREEDATASYPHCVRSSGEAPKQYTTLTAAALPVPEDFDLLDLDDDIESEEPEEEIHVEASELPEGEEKDTSLVGEVTDDAAEEDEFASGDILDDEEVPGSNDEL